MRGFCDWLLPLSVVISRFIQVVGCVSTVYTVPSWGGSAVLEGMRGEVSGRGKGTGAAGRGLRAQWAGTSGHPPRLQPQPQAWGAL